MKPKYIVGGLIALVIIVTAVLTVESKKIEYMDFASVTETGERAQVAGTWVKEKGQEYDANENKFQFTMKDESGNEMLVLYDGAKPNNFELSEMVVATGAVEGDHFRATHILTKCPSKYEADGAELNAGNAY